MSVQLIIFNFQLIKHAEVNISLMQHLAWTNRLIIYPLKLTILTQLDIFLYIFR